MGVATGASRGGALADALGRVRAARNFSETDAARDELKKVLSEDFLDSSRSCVVSVMTRLAGPGSSPDTDRMAMRLNAGWRRLSRRLKVDIDPRVFAYICASADPVYARLADVIGRGQSQQPTKHQVASIVQRLLWGRCEDSCRECLDVPTRFQDYGRPSRSLAIEQLGVRIPEVVGDGESTEWMPRVKDALRSSGRVRVVANPSRQAAVAREIAALLADEFEVGTLLVPASVARVDRDARGWVTTLRLQGGVRAES